MGLRTHPCTHWNMPVRATGVCVRVRECALADGPAAAPCAASTLVSATPEFLTVFRAPPPPPRHPAPAHASAVLPQPGQEAGEGVGTCEARQHVFSDLGEAGPEAAGPWRVCSHHGVLSGVGVGGCVCVCGLRGTHHPTSPCWGKGPSAGGFLLVWNQNRVQTVTNVNTPAPPPQPPPAPPRTEYRGCWRKLPVGPGPARMEGRHAPAAGRWAWPVLLVLLVLLKAVTHSLPLPLPLPLPVPCAEPPDVP